MSDSLMLIAILTALLCSIAVQGSENNAIDCCLKTSNHPIRLNTLGRYENQIPEGGCPISAVVFITKKGKRLCAPVGSDWVTTLKKQLDRKEKRGGAQKKVVGKKPKKPNKANKPKKSKGKTTPAH